MQCIGSCCAPIVWFNNYLYNRQLLVKQIVIVVINSYKSRCPTKHSLRLIFIGFIGKCMSKISRHGNLSKFSYDTAIRLEHEDYNTIFRTLYKYRQAIEVVRQEPSRRKCHRNTVNVSPGEGKKNEFKVLWKLSLSRIIKG